MHPIFILSPGLTNKKHISVPDKGIIINSKTSSAKPQLDNQKMYLIINESRKADAELGRGTCDEIEKGEERDVVDGELSEVGDQLSLR